MDRHGTKLWASWPSHSSVEEAATYLLGPVLGLLLRFRGVTCLHASAVAIGDSVIAFVGAEGAGKSTTAAAFARPGMPRFPTTLWHWSSAMATSLFRPPIRICAFGPNRWKCCMERRMLFLLSFQIGKNAAFLLQTVGRASRMARCLFARSIFWMKFATSRVPTSKPSRADWISRTCRQQLRDKYAGQ